MQKEPRHKIMSLKIINDPMLQIPLIQASSRQKPLPDLLCEHHDEMVETLNKSGALLFRGFCCEDADSFSQAIDACGLGRRDNTKEYDLPRTYLPNDICLSTDIPAHVTLPMHHEKPRSKKPPNHIYFCCAIPATTKGGTIFANASDIWIDTPSAIKKKIIAKGVIYKQFFHGKTMKYRLLKKVLRNKGLLNWPDYYATEDKQKIESLLAATEFQWEWGNRGKDLILLNKLPGVMQHPFTQQTLWMSAVNYTNYYSNVKYGELTSLGTHEYLAMRYLIAKDSLSLVCHFGDGTPFSAKEIEEIENVFQRHTWVLNWQKGDFMIVDNLTLMHGKQPHEGDRLLYSCITTNDSP